MFYALRTRNYFFKRSESIQSLRHLIIYNMRMRVVCKMWEVLFTLDRIFPEKEGERRERAYIVLYLTFLYFSYLFKIISK